MSIKTGLARFVLAIFSLIAMFSANSAFAQFMAGQHIGVIDPRTNNAATGWTCRYQDTADTQGQVAIFAGGPYNGGGTMVASGWADMPAYDENDYAAIASTCGNTPTGIHRYAIGLLNAASTYSGSNRFLWAYDWDGGSNYVPLTNNGLYQLPPAPPTPGGGGSFPFSNIKALLDNGQNYVEILFVGDSHTASFGDSWTSGPDQSSWIYQLGMKLGSKYPNYKIVMYQRRVIETVSMGVTTYTPAAVVPTSGASTCDTVLPEYDIGPFTIDNSAGTKTLVLVQDGIGGSNTERFLARLPTTAPSGNPTPSGQNVAANLLGLTELEPDAVIMMFGVNDSQERYHADGDLNNPNPAYNCYPAGPTTLNGGVYGLHGNALLRNRGTNANDSTQSGTGTPPFYGYFSGGLNYAIAGLKSAFISSTGHAPIVALMTPINAPGLFYDGRSTYAGHVGAGNSLCPTCTFTTGPLNAQLTNAADSTAWALNLKSYADWVFTAGTVSSVNVLDLFGWSHYSVPDSTNFVEIPTASQFGFDIHLKPAGNTNLATVIYNYGFGLN